MKTKDLLIGGSVLVIAYLIWKMKKTKDLQVVKDKQAQIDFANKLQTESKAYAETMNVDLINEKKAKDILVYHNELSKKIISLPTHTVTDRNYLALKKQLNDLEAQLKDLGYKVIPNPRAMSGGRLVKL
jgi:hypothetical protein